MSFSRLGFHNYHLNFQSNLQFAKTLAPSIIRPVFIVLFLFSVLLADDKIGIEPTLKFCRQFSNSEINSVHIVTQENKLYLPLTGGTLLALDTTSGENLWRTDLGGEIVGNILINGSNVFLANEIAATKEKSASIVIRALSLTTGVTVWQGELTEANSVTLTLREPYLLAASVDADGNRKIVALQTGNGAFAWTQAANFTTDLTVAENLIYYTAKDDFLHILGLSNGFESRRLRLPFAVNKEILISNGTVFVSDTKGNFAAINLLSGKTLWKSRFGGSTQKILPVDKGVLIFSLDNFVYFHNSSNGKRIWRRRLANRPLGADLVSDEMLVVTAAGENNATIISLKKGKIETQLLFGANNIALGAPLATANALLIPTTGGVLSFVRDETNCTAK